MKYFFTFCLFLIAVSLHAEDYYWVGGSGDWAEYFYHWAYGSGENPPEKDGKVPGPEDNVIFDENSFASDEDTLYVSFGSDIVCRDLDFSSCTKPIVFGSGEKADIRIYGSLTLMRNMLLSFHQSSCLNFEATTEAHTITSAGQIIEIPINFNGVDGEWTLLDSLHLKRHLNLLYGTLNTNSQKVVLKAFIAGSHNNKKLILGSSLIEVYGGDWAAGGNNLTVEPGTSLIRIMSVSKNFSGTQDYHDIEFVADKSSGQLVGGTFHKVKFNCDGKIRGGCSFNELVLAGWHAYEFQAGKMFNIKEKLSAIGSCTAYIYMGSDTPESEMTLIGGQGATIDTEYLIVKDIHAEGNAEFSAKHSVDLGNNDGWQFQSDAPRDLYWVGGSSIYWDDPQNWSEMSGGSGGACMPTPLDNVFFDQNSFQYNDTVLIRNSTAFCRDMDWGSAKGSPVFLTINLAPINIYGSLTLSSDMKMSFDQSSCFYFEATNAGHTITSAGQIIEIPINFYGVGGEWTLLDSLHSKRIINLMHGTFNTNCKKMVLQGFIAGNHYLKRLILGSSLVEIYGGDWAAGGNNLTVEPGTSFIRIMSVAKNFSGAQDYYDLEFVAEKSQGQLVGGTFNKVIFNCDGKIRGACSFNELILASGHTYEFQSGKMFNIKERFKALGSCTSYIYLGSDTPDSELILIGGQGALIETEYVIVKDIKAEGNAEFLAKHSVDLGNNDGWLFESDAPRNVYWVGGSSIYWDDPLNWSESSGGSGGACMPTPVDNVYFDHNSFQSNDSVLIRNSTAFCRDMDWSSATGSPVFLTINLAPVNIYGSLILSTNMIFRFDQSSCLNLEATDIGHVITSNGQIIDIPLNFNGVGGEWTLVDSLHTSRYINLFHGSLNTNSQKVVLQSFIAGNHNLKKLILGASLIELYGGDWAAGGNNLTVEPGSSLIRIMSSAKNFSGQQDYYDLEFVADQNTNQLVGGTFNRVSFNSDANIRGEATFNILEFKPGHNYIFQANQTFTINKLMKTYGNNCYPIVIQSDRTGEAATIYKKDGEISGDFLELRDIHTEGGAKFYAGNNSTDVSGNRGWRFTNSPKYIYGFGEDRVFCIGDTLFTTYFNDPDSYLWDDGSTKSYRIIDKAGQYWVKCTYGDKCFWADSINAHIINLYHENIDNMTIIEDAYHADTTVVLTPSAPWQYGGMWYNVQVAISEGFSTEFTFMMNDAVNEYNIEKQPGADGFAFIVQNYTNDKLGRQGGGVGFEDMPNCFAVEFDTYFNTTTKINDPNENHLGVFCNGTDSNTVNHNSSACLATVDLLDKMPIKSDGTIYYCQIDYNYEDKKFTMYMDSTGEYKEPILELNDIDFSEMLDLKQDEFAWVGFSSATGDVYETHEILSWYMCPTSTRSVLTGVEEIEWPWGEGEENSSISEIKLYPNPASEFIEAEFAIKAPALYSIEIVDIMGRGIYSKQETLQAGIYKNHIELPPLMQGVYFVKISGLAFVRSSKFLLR